jgi:hypothetical protein
LKKKVIIGVRVDIDEAWSKRQAGRLDDTMPHGWGNSSDLCNAIAGDDKVGAVRWTSGAVDKISVSNHKVIHCCPIAFRYQCSVTTTDLFNSIV